MTITLISADELHRNSSSFLILDTRPHAHYLEGHIPGAVSMEWHLWCEDAPVHAESVLAQAGYWGVLKDDTMDELADRLGQFGVSDDRPVVVYADGPRSKGREARVAWMLLYYGIPSVFLLNGGWSAWLRQQGGIETAIPQHRYGRVHLCIQEHRRVRLPQLRHDMQRGQQPLWIDTRSREEFAGQLYEYQPRMGRLPDAIHLPYIDFFEDGCFVTQQKYFQRLPSVIMQSKRCVPYCEVGVRSCLFALLHELYTGQVIANFDGSIMEWSLDETLPMHL